MQRTILICGCFLVGACFTDAGASGADRQTARESLKASAEANNRFAIKMIAHLSRNVQPDQNLAISPISATTAIAILYAGANGETASEMGKIMEFQSDRPDFHELFSDFRKQLTLLPHGSSGKLSTANAVFAGSRIPLEDSFRQKAKTFYGAEVLEVGRGDGTGEREQLDRWVANETKGLITKALPTGVELASTDVAIVNAVYFKSAWSEPFKVSETRDSWFKAGLNDRVKAKMMKHVFRLPLKYGSSPILEFVELPYEANRHSMVIVMPRAEAKETEVVESIGRQGIDALLKSGSPAKVTIQMPRVSITESTDVAAILRSLGLRKALSPSADFSRLSAAKPTVAAIQQQCVVHVDELGTTAAAATDIILNASDPQAIDLVLDRPFFFFIRDCQVGAIIFAGRLGHP